MRGSFCIFGAAFSAAKAAAGPGITPNETPPDFSKTNWLLEQCQPSRLVSQLHCREGVGKTKAELDAAAKAALDAFHLCPNLDILVPALVEGGPGELQRRCSLTPGVLRIIGQGKRLLQKCVQKLMSPET